MVGSSFGLLLRLCLCLGLSFGLCFHSILLPLDFVGSLLLLLALDSVPSLFQLALPSRGFLQLLLLPLCFVNPASFSCSLFLCLCSSRLVEFGSFRFLLLSLDLLHLKLQTLARQLGPLAKLLMLTKRLGKCFPMQSLLLFGMFVQPASEAPLLVNVGPAELLNEPGRAVLAVALWRSTVAIMKCSSEAIWGMP